MCDGSVTTVCACAKVKRAPWLASRSRFGVCAGPPYADSASARSVSIVTSRTFCAASGCSANAGVRPRQVHASRRGRDGHERDAGDETWSASRNPIPFRISQTRTRVMSLLRAKTQAQRGARHARGAAAPREHTDVSYTPAAIAHRTRRPHLFVYWSVHRFDLVNWDDSTYITENPTVLGGLSWSSAWWALTTGHSPYWHPMTWLSHLLDVSLFGTDAGAYHVTNLVLHVASTLLLFEIFRRMTGATGRSAFVAAIFAVHPLHVESVAWIAERKDVLSTFFWMLTLAAYVALRRQPSRRRYALVMALYALALMSKPMVVTLPVVLLLLDVWPLRRLHERRPLGMARRSWQRRSRSWRWRSRRASPP